ncbi:hypothetical protein DdX_19446 [Ditylenchus destructor]|uniref:Uncharacterized protein n=1 Tax=Ditylenchus destructor TaxID=166010 RepID=A0AAD4QX48_9BILA|nr:hypothetical protein DdX_19446 [Ditylenchus destructor]
MVGDSTGTTCNFDPYGSGEFLSEDFLNATALEEKLTKNILAKTNNTVADFLHTLGIGPTPAIFNKFTEYVAIVYLVLNIIRYVKEGIVFVWKLYQNCSAKKEAEKDERSVRISSMKVSKKAQQLVHYDIAPAAEYVLVHRNETPRKVKIDKIVYPDGPYRGRIVDVGAGTYVAIEKKYRDHEFETGDLVFVKGEGQKVFDDGSQRHLYLYHIREVLAAIKQKKYRDHEFETGDLV